MSDNKIIASNGYINIIDIKYGINDMIKTNNNRYKKIRYNKDGMPYFIQNNIRYNLNEFFKV